jgi:hypothetical protein
LRCLKDDGGWADLGNQDYLTKLAFQVLMTAGCRRRIRKRRKVKKKEEEARTIR